MKPLIFLAFLAIGVATSLGLGGCNGNGTLRGSGEIAPTPAGHAKLCAEQPTFPGCPK